MHYFAPMDLTPPYFLHVTHSIAGPATTPGDTSTHYNARDPNGGIEELIDRPHGHPDTCDCEEDDPVWNGHADILLRPRRCAALPRT